MSTRRRNEREDPSDAVAAAFEPGRRAMLRGTEVEVLGRARWRTSDGYVFHEVALRTADAERWTLELDDGHAVLWRGVPADPAWPAGTDPLAPPAGEKVVFDRKRFAFPAERATLVGVSGEYWKDLEPGDVEVSRAFVSAPTVLGASKEPGDSSWEWSQGVYLDRRLVEEAFGVTLPAPTDPHPARPVPYRAWTRLLGRLSLGLGIAGLVLSLSLDSGGGQPLFAESVPVESAAGETFAGVLDVESPVVAGFRVGATGLHQTWAFVEASLTPVPPEGQDAEDWEPEVLGHLATELSYYEGVDDEGHWSEGSLEDTQGFRLEGGSYMVHLAWEIDPQQPLPIDLRVAVVPGYRSGTALLVVSILLLAYSLFYFLYKRAIWNSILVDAGLREEEDDD